MAGSSAREDAEELKALRQALLVRPIRAMVVFAPLRGWGRQLVWVEPAALGHVDRSA